MTYSQPSHRIMHGDPLQRHPFALRHLVDRNGMSDKDRAGKLFIGESPHGMERPRVGRVGEHDARVPFPCPFTQLLAEF